MIPRILKIILLLVLVSVFALPNFSGIAQEECNTVEECEALWKKLQEEIKRLEGTIAKTEQEKKTLQNQISILRNRINQLDLQIRQSTIVIGDLGNQIQDTEGSIRETTAKIEENTQMLSAVLRTIYEEDQRSLTEILLSEGIADFFENLVALEALSDKNKELLGDIKSLKDYLESQKQSLDSEKSELEGVVKMQTLQLRESDAARREQERLLGMTEVQYQQYLKEQEEVQSRAAEIRRRIFELVGVPDAPTFGEAYNIAKYVESITGVRPAFLLAILHQESRIGQNVGQCYIADTTSGASVSIATGQRFVGGIHPTRDLPPFLQITQELGRDPLNTPISCQIPSVGGYGGAMGPAQFIPSTWMLVRDRVASISGRSADPWDIFQSFLASGILLSDLGAKNSEFCAAISYFSGSCRLINQQRYGWYANSVINIANNFEKDIKILEQAR